MEFASGEVGTADEVTYRSTPTGQETHGRQTHDTSWTQINQDTEKAGHISINSAVVVIDELCYQQEQT